MSITTAQIITEIRRLAAEKPDFTYKKPFADDIERNWCANFTYGEKGNKVGSCIVGQALLNCGVNLSAGEQYKSFGRLIHKVGWTHSFEEYDWISSVQYRQDVGDTWGTAVAQADKRFEELALV